MPKAKSPYRRDDWFGDDADSPSIEHEAGEYGVGDGPTTNPGPAGEYRSDPNDPAAIVAFRILRKSATILCSRSQDEPDDLDLHDAPGEVELSEPIARPPTDTVRGQRHRVRVNEEYGYLSGGHSTGCIIKDRPAEDFLAVVDEWLTSAVHLPPSRREQLRNEAASLKHGGEVHDVEIMRRIVEEARK